MPVFFAPKIKKNGEKAIFKSSVKVLSIGRNSMAYMLSVCVAGGTVEMKKYHTGRAYAKGEKRKAKIKPSKEAQKELNYRNAEDTLRRLMNHNFVNGDHYLTLDFRKEERPESVKELQLIAADFVKRCRARLKKAGVEMKYIYCMERGSKGACHLHMVVNDGLRAKDYQELWKYGAVHLDPLNTYPDFGRLASYFIKYARKTESAEASLGKKWYASRNLDKPVVEKMRISANTFRNEPMKVDGYEICKETERMGISSFDGYEYYSVRLYVKDGKKVNETSKCILTKLRQRSAQERWSRRIRAGDAHKRRTEDGKRFDDS